MKVPLPADEHISEPRTPSSFHVIPQMDAQTTSLSESVRGTIISAIDDLNSSLRVINKELHSHPELAYEEVFAHKLLSDYLESQGFNVQRHAWGIDTAFEASIGSGGRQVVFCAEYDALPGLGHACGHNLIATSSVAAFLGAAAALKEMKIPGRLRLLGTPAEERYGGKIALIKKGAFEPAEDVSAAIMAHAANHGFVGEEGEPDGIAGVRSKSVHEMTVEFHGRSSHASASPWQALNALDAAIASYNNVSLLRQQIQPNDRISGVFQVGGTVANVIPEYTRMSWNVRSPTLKQSEALVKRVVACFEAGAAATGCRMQYKSDDPYEELWPLPSLCSVYAEDMATLGLNIIPMVHTAGEASTDMGNVSHHVPSFHGVFTIPTPPGVSPHNEKFAAAAGTDEAHAAAIQCAKGMAMLAIRVLTDEKLAKSARKEFDDLAE